MSDLETTEPDDGVSPFARAWRAFVEANPKIKTMSAPQRAMLRRGFVYGWQARGDVND